MVKYGLYLVSLPILDQYILLIFYVTYIQPTS